MLNVHITIYANIIDGERFRRDEKCNDGKLLLLFHSIIETINLSITLEQYY